MSINYRIHAQYMPVLLANLSCKEKMISSFAGHLNIEIANPGVQSPPKQIAYKAISRVGGFLGIRQTACTLKIYLEKKEFFIGENIVMHIDIDNSRCAKDVKNIKAKLIQAFKAYDQTTRRSVAMCGFRDVFDLTWPDSGAPKL